MIRINQLKMPMNSAAENLDDTLLRREILKALRIAPERMLGYEVIKRSIDARKADDVHYTYCIDVKIDKEADYLKQNRNKNIVKSGTILYALPKPVKNKKKERPVVCGSGPAGMFCAYFLSLAGFNPIVIERGMPVEKRAQIVEHFWNTGELDPETNVQFGEGGAGTFSDGKLNTMVKDTYGRIRRVLKIFVQFGAPEEILYQNKPHIGTDCLRNVVAAMRAEIQRLGGEFLFQTRLDDIAVENGKLSGILCNKKQWYNTSTLILAIGHSARDTFQMLYEKGLCMEKKPFAVGVRVEHRQDFINRAQYKAAADILPPADYKLTHTAASGRGVYSFCMCPGGYVVNASSEQGRLVVNGMSDHARDGRNANSALIVTVTPEDFPTDTPLAGIQFQQHYEKLAYQIAGGAIPYQLYGDLLAGKKSTGFGRIVPDHRGSAAPSDLRECLPDYVVKTLLEGMDAFGQKIPGYADEEAVFSGVEMRTSSPVRIVRDAQFMGSISGIYPCGEGAGYAGGIMSAAIDGIKVFEAVCAGQE